MTQVSALCQSEIVNDATAVIGPVLCADDRSNVCLVYIKLVFTMHQDENHERKYILHFECNIVKKPKGDTRGREGERERGREGERERGREGERERGRRGDGEARRRGDGETGRRGDGERATHAWMAGRLED